MPPLTIAQLTTLYKAKLASSGLTPKDGLKLGLDPTLAVDMGKLGYKKFAAMRIPYFNPQGELIKFERVRYLEDTRVGFDKLLKKKERRYDQLKGTGVQCYLPPLLKMPWEVILKEPDVPLLITEGELKAACATRNMIACIGLGGVWNFSGSGPGELLPSLEGAKWEERTVHIAFDSDAATNEHVVQAENRLAKYLTERGASVLVTRLPSVYDDPAKKTGVDDYILVRGIEAFKRMLEEESEEFSLSAELRELNEEVVFVSQEKTVIQINTGLRMNYTDFTKLNYSNRKFWTTNKDGDDIQKPTAPAWLEWKYRRELNKSTYAPGAERIIDMQLNLWNGWGCEPIEGDIGPWKELLDYVFSSDPNNGELHRQWLERWFAYPLQHPGAKHRTAPVLVGPQGTGKTLTFDIVKMLYGANAISITNKHFSTDHNTWAANKQFIVGNEILTGGDRWEITEALKEMITRETVLINPKFVNEYELPDCGNFGFTSNKPHALMLEDDDRRYFVHRVPARKQSNEFYDRVSEWKKNGGPSALFYHLLHLPLGNFNPNAEAPGSVAKEEMKSHGRNVMADWVFTLKNAPDEVTRIGKTLKTYALWTVEELFTLFVDQRCPEGPGKFTTQLLSRELRSGGIEPGAYAAACRVSSGLTKIWVVRDADKYQGLSSTELSEAYEKERGATHPGLKKRKF